MSKIEIESAFVEPWNRNEEQHPAWAMKTAEPHSKKDEAGKWQTVGRTFRTIKASRESGIDFTQFRKGDRVHVWGTEKTETREYESSGETRKAYDLIVWADRVELAESGRDLGPVGEPTKTTWDTAEPPQEYPF